MNKHITEVCKIGQGAATCRYLLASAAGWECAKISGLKSFLDQRAEAKTMRALGDNCEGKSSEFLNAE